MEDQLKLFRLVCAAVQHAHQNLVVHRDLKPANVLVTREGTPKLLDFGIAKLLEEGREGEATITAMRVLTPEYASPEQIRGEAVTTVTDVYSLGLMLYETLTGTKAHSLKSGAAAEVERVICHQQAELPSLTLGRRQETGTAPAAMAETIERRRRQYCQTGASQRAGTPLSFGGADG